MIDHKARDHAEWSASASARNAVCAGAIAMCSMVDGKESEAAAWGTLCHELADTCMKEPSIAPCTFEGQERKVGRFTFIVDEEMIDLVDGYIERCWNDINAERNTLFWIEESLPLDKLNPPLPAGGTGDLVLYRVLTKILKIRDLKTGRGVFVDAKGSWQMRSYGLGALLAHPELDVEWVEVTIDQPRLQRDGDGGVRSERFHVADLYDWAATMLKAMKRAADAKAEFLVIRSNRVAFDIWAEKWLTTGQCTFCDAKALCPKVRQEALATLPQIAQKWFETPDDTRPPELSNAAMLLSTEELAHALNGLDLVEAWAKAVRDRGHSEAERGVKIPGWKLVQKIGNRAWISEDAAAAKLLALGLKPEQVSESKTISPAKADGLLKKRKDEIRDLWHKPARGLNFVQEDKSDRPAVAGKTATFHEAVE